MNTWRWWGLTQKLLDVHKRTMRENARSLKRSCDSTHAIDTRYTVGLGLAISYSISYHYHIIYLKKRAILKGCTHTHCAFQHLRSTAPRPVLRHRPDLYIYTALCACLDAYTYANDARETRIRPYRRVIYRRRYDDGRPIDFSRRPTMPRTFCVCLEYIYLPAAYRLQAMQVAPCNVRRPSQLLVVL